MKNSERASYIRGLMEGLQLDPNAKETKVLNAMADLLDDLCAAIEELEDGFSDLGEVLDEIDEDLGNLEADYYGDDEDEDDECGCEGCHHHHHHDDETEFEVTCPSCGEGITLTDDMLEEGGIICPHCGEHLEFDFDEEDEDEEDGDGCCCCGDKEEGEGSCGCGCGGEEKK